MDIWEANTVSTAVTAHACDVKNQTRCEGTNCGDGPERFEGVCDKNGCDFQTFRLKNETFWGPGPQFAIDSTKPVTVTTQFVTSDGTDNGPLSEIRRFYKQGGKVIATPTLMVGSGMYNSISTDYCTAEVGLFQDHTNFLDKGGFSSMDDAFEKGVVLVMSMWDDHEADMLWLDSTYPINGTSPGDARGTCATTTGVPATVEKDHPSAHVTFSNIKFGEIGSTGGPSPPGPSPPTPPTPSGCPGGTLSACIGLCPSTPAPAYKACVSECVKRCPGVAAESDGVTRADKWGLCASDAHCPAGWQCAERTDHRQCIPSAVLVDAFHLTHPTAEAVADFVATGKTLFPAAGLPEEFVA